MAKSIKNTIVCSLCPLYDTCKFELEGLPPCALVAQNSTDIQQLKAEISQVTTDLKEHCKIRSYVLLDTFIDRYEKLSAVE